MLCKAQQSKIPTTITCKLHHYCWVFILQSTNPQEIHRRRALDVSLCEDRSSKNLAAQFENATVTPMMNDGRGPQEWSHDAFMMICMYPNAME